MKGLWESIRGSRPNICRLHTHHTHAPPPAHAPRLALHSTSFRQSTERPFTARTHAHVLGARARTRAAVTFCSLVTARTGHGTFGPRGHGPHRTCSIHPSIPRTGHPHGVGPAQRTARLLVAAPQREGERAREAGARAHHVMEVRAYIQPRSPPLFHAATTLLEQMGVSGVFKRPKKERGSNGPRRAPWPAVPLNTRPSRHVPCLSAPSRRAGVVGRRRCWRVVFFIFFRRTD